MTESTPVENTPNESEYVEIKYFSPDVPTGAISAYTSNKRYIIYEREPGQYALETQDSNLKKNIVDLFTDTEGIDQTGVICMDAVQDSLLVLLCVQGEEYYLVNIDSEGNFLSKTTVTVIYIANGTRTDVCVLSNEVQETKEEIQFLNLAGIASSYTKSRAASFSRVEGNTIIKFEEITGEEEDIWNLTLAEFAAGKGPDIICFTENNEKLQTLYEKGLLADMTEFIPKETQNQIFPAIVKSGKIGEDWVALIPEATGKSLLVSNQLWEKEHWELEDILHISESNEQTEGLTINTYFKSKASFVLGALVFDSFENSPFIDMDNHESHFEDELFQKLLETAKLQGQESKIIGENEVKDLVKNGNYVVLDFNSGSMYELVNILNNYGDDCHTVGYPGQSEGIGYWLPSYVIAVNKNTKHKEVISAFLQFLLEGDSQVLSNYMPVREDVIRENVFYDEWSVPPAWYYRAQMEKGMRGGTAISNPNGDSYLEEIIQYLNNLGVSETAPESIRNIITDETEDFFSGGRDAKQVADAIDNRVQLYLDEQN
ncbi:MAG TPA: extracellular solute-binding protein [Lachnospiraceae bacterium]|nr:extracellular solute-binding protein [Lachnospiraceae bacterium]